MVRVKSLSRNNKRYDVTFTHDDGSESVFSLSEDLVVEYRLVPGKTLDAPGFAAFRVSAESDGLYQKALTYVLRYPQTETGLRTYLADRSAKNETIESILFKLKRIGVIDDDLFAQRYVEDHGKTRREGSVKLIFDLQRRGIARDIVSRAIAAITPERERENLNALFDQKWGSLKGYPQQKAMMLMSRHLVSKGYEPETVHAFVSARSGLFAARHSDDDLIHADYRDVLCLADRAGWNGPERRAKIIQRLLQKGYYYPSIKKKMEKGDDSDE